MQRTISVPASEAPGEQETVARTYQLYIPNGYDPNRPYQLLFAYHSCGGDGESGFPREVVYQSGDSTLIVSPTGLSPSDDCHGNGWSSPSDLPLFDGIYEEITAEFCVDLNRVFSTGHSYGGEMTNRLNCERGNLLAGTSSRSGGLAGQTDCVGPPPATFLAHVEGDTSPAPFSASETLLPIRLADRGCDGEDAFTVNEQGCRVYTGCRTPVTYCRCMQPVENCPMWTGVVDNPHGITSTRPFREAAWRFLEQLP